VEGMMPFVCLKASDAQGREPVSIGKSLATVLARETAPVRRHSVVVLIFRRLLERWGETDYLKVDREADVLNCFLTVYDYDRGKKKLVLKGFNTICYTDSD
jgi:hypothetical protein